MTSNRIFYGVAALGAILVLALVVVSTQKREQGAGDTPAPPTASSTPVKRGPLRVVQTNAQHGEAWGALLQDAERGEVPAAAVVSAWLEREAARWGMSPDAVTRRFDETIATAARRMAGAAATGAAAERLALLKSALLQDPQLVYNKDATTLGHVLLERRVQCGSASLWVVLAWLVASQSSRQHSGARPVFVHTNGHVQPGVVQEDTLSFVEGTARDASATQLSLHRLSNMQVTDASHEMALSLLGEHAPAWLRDRLEIGRGPIKEAHGKSDEHRNPNDFVAGFGSTDIPSGDLPLAALTSTNSDAPGRSFTYSLPPGPQQASDGPQAAGGETRREQVKKRLAPLLEGSGPSPEWSQRLLALLADSRSRSGSNDKPPCWPHGEDRILRDLMSKEVTAAIETTSQFAGKLEGRCAVVVDQWACAGKDYPECPAWLFVERRGKKWRRKDKRALKNMRFPRFCGAALSPPWRFCLLGRKEQDSRTDVLRGPYGR